MKLYELLDITGLGVKIEIKQFFSRHNKIDIASFCSINEKGVMDTEQLLWVKKRYGEYEVVNQNIKNDSLVILIKTNSLNLV